MAGFAHSVSVRFTALMGGFTGPLRAAGGSLTGFGRGISNAGRTITGMGSRINALNSQIGNLQRRMAAAPPDLRPAYQQQLQALNNQRNVLQRQQQAFQRLGHTASIAAVGMVAGFGYAVKAAADFDKAMSKVASVSHVSGKEMDALRKIAIQQGKDTKFSAKEAADAEVELAKAGISTADILGGALKGALALSAAGEISVAESATVAAQAMHIFGLQGKDVSHVADVLAAGANKSAADIHGLAWSLKMGGQVAAQMGLSLEDTVGTLSAFADNALIGSDAGTSLKTMLMRLSNPTDKAAGLMDDLGIETYDASGNFVGMTQFAGNLQGALQGLTAQERNQALATIFGADATRAANILYKIGAKGINDYTLAVNDNGAAARTAAKQMDNLAGDLEFLRGSIETALIQSGSGANSVLRQMVKAVTGVVNAFVSLPASVQSTGTIIIGLTGAVILFTKAGIFMVNTVKDMRIALAALGFSAQRQAATMLALRGALASTASFMAGPWGLAIGAAVAILGVWYFSKKKAAKATDEFVSAIEADSGALATNTRAAVANALEKEGLLKIGQQLNITGPQLVSAILKEGDAYDRTVGHLKEYLTSLEKRKSFAQEHGGPDFDNEHALNKEIEATKKLISGLKDQSGSVRESAESFKRKTAATQLDVIANQRVTTAIGGHVDAENEIVKMMGDSEKGAENLKNALDELAGANMTLDRALIAQREEYKKTAAASDHRAGLSDKETSQLLDLVDANNKVVESMISDGVAGDKVVATQNRLYNQFIKAAEAMGLDSNAAKALADRYGVLKLSSASSTASMDKWTNKALDAASAARHLAIRTGGDATSGQNAFRASIQRMLPVLYAMTGGDRALRAQVDALAKSTGAVTGRLGVSRSAFMATARSMGVSSKEANRLWKELAKIKSKAIKVSVDAKGQWKAFNNGVAVPGSERPGFAKGGRVPSIGPESSRDYDSVPSILRVDEHVWTPEEVDAIGGHAAMYRMRREAKAGRLKGYASGGRVSQGPMDVPGGYHHAIDPVVSGANAMIVTMINAMAKEIKKAMSGGGVVAAARSQIGRPYSWGGGGPGGPSYGIGRGAGTYGFDCSGLTEYAWWKGAHTEIGGTTDPQAAGSHAIGGPRPGALGFVGNPIHHVMLGSDKPGYVIQAPFTGSFVQEVQRTSSNWRWPNNAKAMAKGGAVTRAERLAGQRFINGQGDLTAKVFGLAGDPGGIAGYANGGLITGAPGRDRLLLRGTAGEFMVNRNASRRYGPWLDMINSGVGDSLIQRSMRSYNGNGGGGSTSLVVHVHNHGVLGSQAETQRWLTSSLENLRRLNRLPAGRN